jgi:trans-aconitate methyltransferase
MIEPLPFEPRRFRSAAAHYVSGRPAYATRLIRRVVELTGLKPSHRVMDLGCGPGQLALAFAPHAAEVIGIDPEPEMLRVAASRDGPGNIRWIEGSSYDIGPLLGRFHFVTMGRSFHWMDRVDTLRRLDGLIDPGGAIALFWDDHPDLPDNQWHRRYREVVNKYTEETESCRRRRMGAWIRHEAPLFNSAFSELEEIGIIERQRIRADSLIDRALSLSAASRATIGDRADEMAEELRALMAELAPEGTITEVVTTSALLARRPSA